MNYEVRFVEDGELPGGVEFVFARAGGQTTLFIKASTIDHTTGKCDALTRSFTAWEALRGRQPVRA